MARRSTDVLVVGGGHNGLVAAAVCAKAGLRVRLVERAPVLGGAARTETPFARVPELKASTGAYLLGLMPPELMRLLEVDIPVLKRDPHYFLPTTGAPYLLVGSDARELERQYRSFFGERDWEAHQRLQAEIGALRDDVAPTWLQAPLSIEATAERYVRPALRQAFVDLCRGSVGAYLERFGFESDLIKAMYAVTDGFSGLYGTWDTPGTGMNFLVHNMCRLPGSDGTWMIVRGGMGTVSHELAGAARRFGARLDTDAEVVELCMEQGCCRGAVLASGERIDARAVMFAGDPFRMRALAGAARLPQAYNARLDGYVRPGSTLKVNLAMRALPRFTCLPEDRGQYRTTTHLLPQEGNVIQQLIVAFAEAQAGRLASQPTIEWYQHTTVDGSLQDPRGHHCAALFVQWVPYAIDGSSWDAELDGYVSHLLSLCDRFAPGTSDLVEDVFALPPPAIESHFGITHGHIHHVDNSFGFADRLAYRTPVDGLYAAGAGCHPAGSVIGAAGHNAAQQVLEDLGLPACR